MSAVELRLRFCQLLSACLACPDSAENAQKFSNMKIVKIVKIRENEARLETFNFADLAP